MINPPKISQTVTVDLARFDSGLRDVLRRAVGAPKGASVRFHDGGVRITWDRRKRFNG